MQQWQHWERWQWWQRWQQGQHWQQWQQWKRWQQWQRWQQRQHWQQWQQQQQWQRRQRWQQRQQRQQWEQWRQWQQRQRRQHWQKWQHWQQWQRWQQWQWLWSHLSFFYYSKVEFTTVNTFSNVTGFSHFTMVNTDLVCCGGNGGRIKAKFTIVNFPETIWFISDISKLCLFRWHLVALFEMRSLSVTLLNTYTPPAYSFPFFVPNSTVEMSQWLRQFSLSFEVIP